MAAGTHGRSSRLLSTPPNIPCGLGLSAVFVALAPRKTPHSAERHRQSEHENENCVNNFLDDHRFNVFLATYVPNALVSAMAPPVRARLQRTRPLVGISCADSGGETCWPGPTERTCEPNRALPGAQPSPSGRRAHSFF
jgi:hypothetical protein